MSNSCHMLGKACATSLDSSPRIFSSGSTQGAPSSSRAACGSTAMACLDLCRCRSSDPPWTSREQLQVSGLCSTHRPPLRCTGPSRTSCAWSRLWGRTGRCSGPTSAPCAEADTHQAPQTFTSVGTEAADGRKVSWLWLASKPRLRLHIPLKQLRPLLHGPRTAVESLRQVLD